MKFNYMKKIIPLLFLCLVSSIFAQNKLNQQNDLITAKGWGKVQLGTKKKEVEKVLGKPEILDPINDVIFAEYPSKGIDVSYLTKSKTVNAIFFYNNERFSSRKYAVFPNSKTDKGVDWNSTEEELIDLYGIPKEDYKGVDSGGTWRRIVYEGMDFRFESERMVRIGIFIETKEK